MSAIIRDGFSLPVLKIGRIAGQYAKPRSSPDETRNGVTLLLHYDSALTRLSPADHLWYNCAAHTVWLGDRTSEPSQAHVQYLRV